MISNEEVRSTVVEAVRDFFQVMLKEDVGLGREVADQRNLIPVDVSGIIRIADSNHPVTFVLGFKQATLFLILSQKYGRAYTEIDDSVRQGVSELANIIYGQIKSKMNTRGVPLKMSFPTTKVENNHLISSEYSQHLNFIFKFQGHEFSVCFGYESI